MKIDFAARVEIGERETNDDRVLIDGQILDRNSHTGTLELPAIAVVCDGCGGYLGGGIAAQTVLETLATEEAEDLTDASYLAQVLDQCELDVNYKKSQMPQFSKMCTTIAGCVFYEKGMLIFHSGDSRVYRHDRWGIAQMTIDHSYVQNLVDRGEISPEEALTHPERNVITRCIGNNGKAPEIYVSGATILPEEKYLFCSDGLWESVSEIQIRGILDSELSLEQMTDTLVELALHQGSDDNISVCICQGQGKSEVVERTPFILD